jgi:histidine triad (HIT) family protein
VSDDCLFCRIARNEIPADIVYSDDDTLAFRDIQPQAPVHVLVIPRRHLASLDAATDADIALLGRLTLSADQVARSQGIEVSGYRCVVNTGPDAQQSVQHFHLHVLGGRPMSWPPG